MQMPVTRRAALAVALAAAFCAQAARATGSGKGWDGTWGGANSKGETVQLIFAGDKLIGFYWRDNYMDTSGERVAAGGNRLDFSFSGYAAGTVTVTRAGAGAVAVVKEPGKGEVREGLKKD